MKDIALTLDAEAFANAIVDHPRFASVIEIAIQKASSSAPAKSRAQEDELMDVGQAAKYLGLAKATLYEKTSTRQIPFMKAGDKKLIFKRSDLDKWLESGRRKTQAEIRAEAEEYVRASKKRR